MPFSKLPYDIILVILSYIHKPQNKDLLNDIEHYAETKEKLFKIYNNIYKTSSYTYFLMLDISLFLNNNEDVLIFSYKDKCINVFLRNPFLNDNNVIKYIMKLEKHDILSQINTYWALMNTCERNRFLANIR